MSNNLKIGLVFGILLLGILAGFGYYRYAQILPEPSLDRPGSSLSPSVTVSAAPVLSVVDDLVDVSMLDISSETGMINEEFSELSQALLSESQAISEFGQAYDSTELF